MIRLFLIVVLMTGLVGAGATAEVQPMPSATSPAQAQKPSEPDANPAEIKTLVQTLNDPAARSKLVRQLNLLAAQQTATGSAKPADAGSHVLGFLSDRVSEASAEFSAVAHAFIGFPAALRWLYHQLSDPITRAHWIQLAFAVGVVLGGGGAALVLAELVIARPRRAIERHEGLGFGGRLGLATLRLLLRLVPVGIFGAVSYSLLPTFSVPATVNVATITIVDATMLVLLVVAVSRFLLAPRVPALRLVPIGSRTATLLHLWLCWLGGIVALGWCGISAAALLGLPEVASQGAIKVLGFVVLMMLLILVGRTRGAVEQWIRGTRRKDDDKSGAPGHKGALWATRQRVAEIWHLLIGIFLVLAFMIWVLDVDGGFDFLIHGTSISILVLVAARVVANGLEHVARPGISLSQGTSSRFPHLKARFDHYLPTLTQIGTSVVWLIALLALIDVWGLDTFGWFETSAGRAVLARALSIAFVVVSATIAWEIVSAVIERYLVGTGHNGSPVERSQRVRTLLPLLRNAFLIFLIVVVVLLVLSEIGLNIAPLLAGAGVVGLAIGFGAQTLVKDVITGVFILFENTIAVGDVVDVGGGHSGLVESFSVRTIKLRDNAGSVHTVPFSNVTSVVNMTKDYAFYVFNIKVDYGQDTDRVVEQVRALGAELQADSAFCDFILAPIEVIGVDSFGPDAVILQARIKTRPLRQWSVGREFNRRLKKRFDGLKIPLSFPQSVIVLPDPSKAVPPSDVVDPGSVVGE